MQVREERSKKQTLHTTSYRKHPSLSLRRLILYLKVRPFLPAPSRFVVVLITVESKTCFVSISFKREKRPDARKASFNVASSFCAIGSKF
jgi:hypothetical protein